MNKKTIAPTDEEINKVLNEVAAKIEEGGSRFRGLTFEQGIEAGIMWIIGDTDEEPYPEN